MLPGIGDQIFCVIRREGKTFFTSTCATYHSNHGKPYYHLLDADVRVLAKVIGKDGVHFSMREEALTIIHREEEGNGNS